MRSLGYSDFESIQRTRDDGLINWDGGISEETCDNSIPSTVFYLESEGVLSVQPTTWHPGFGQEEQNNCIVVAFTNNELITRLGW